MNEAGNSALSSILGRLRLQEVLFSSHPRRDLLLQHIPTWPLQKAKIRVTRNHSFEPLRTIFDPCLKLCGYEPVYEFSDYNDSLALDWLDPDDKVSVELFWVDFDRYKLPVNELANWLTGRILDLRSRTNAPILWPLWLEPDSTLARSIYELSERTPGLAIADLARIKAIFGKEFFDEQRANTYGTRLSNRAQARIAQELGLRWTPAVLEPPIKAVAVDLDNTLYEGVLGEDGIHGLTLTDGHRALQTALVEMAKNGTLISIISKNNTNDVERLFAERNDFPLSLNYVSAVFANWQAKAKNIELAAKKFNISVDSFLFIDDNHAELTAVGTSIPRISLLHAQQDGSETARHLSLFPKTLKLHTDDSDRKRAADLEANEIRHLLVQDLKPESYLKELETTATFSIRPSNEMERLYSITQKTNQFNLALRRFNAKTIDNFIHDERKCVITVKLQDKLSDSGNVAAIFFSLDDSNLVVEELCVSCRALGRRVEDVIIPKAIELAADELKSGNNVVFKVVSGPRNEPAISWLSRLAQVDIDENLTECGIRSITIPLADIRIWASKLADAINMHIAQGSL